MVSSAFLSLSCFNLHSLRIPYAYKFISHSICLQVYFEFEMVQNINRGNTYYDYN